MQMVLTKISEPRWTVPLVALLFISLLGMFYAVVNEATKAGELRRHARATHTADVMRCNAMPNWSATRQCRTSLDSGEPPEESVLLASR